MRSFVCRDFGNPDAIAIEDLADPVPGPGEVLVRMTAANVAFVDRLIVRGEYQVRPPLPFTPGVVAAGEVLGTGDGVEHLQPGTSVVVLKSAYGAWSTHIVVPAWAVVPTPANVPDEIAAAAIEAYGTASYALEERGGLAPGETVLIMGAGGAVGAAAVEIALHLDAEVIAHTSDASIWDDHRVKPQHIIDRNEHPDIRAYMREHFPAGVDLAMDPVSGDQANGILRSLAPNGRMLRTSPSNTSPTFRVSKRRSLAASRSCRSASISDITRRRRRRSTSMTMRLSVELMRFSNCSRR